MANAGCEISWQSTRAQSWTGFDERQPAVSGYKVSDLRRKAAFRKENGSDPPVAQANQADPWVNRETARPKDTLGWLMTMFMLNVPVGDLAPFRSTAEIPRVMKRQRSREAAVPGARLDRGDHPIFGLAIINKINAHRSHVIHNCG